MLEHNLIPLYHSLNDQYQDDQVRIAALKQENEALQKELQLLQSSALQ